MAEKDHVRKQEERAIRETQDVLRPPRVHKICWASVCMVIACDILAPTAGAAASPHGTRTSLKLVVFAFQFESAPHR